MFYELNDVKSMANSTKYRLHTRGDYQHNEFIEVDMKKKGYV